MGTSGYIRFVSEKLGKIHKCRCKGCRHLNRCNKFPGERCFYNHFDSNPSREHGLGFRLFKFIRNLYSVDYYLINQTNTVLYQKTMRYLSTATLYSSLPSGIYFDKLFKKYTTNEYRYYGYTKPLLSQRLPELQPLSEDVDPKPVMVISRFCCENLGRMT